MIEFPSTPAPCLRGACGPGGRQRQRRGRRLIIWAKLPDGKLQETPRGGTPEKVGRTEEQIGPIEKDHQDLRRAPSQELPFKARLDRCDDTNTFDEGWAMCSGRFPRLKLFAGVLATDGRSGLFWNQATEDRLQDEGIVEKHLEVDEAEGEEEDEDEDD
eukprot:UC4_evm1s198